MKQEFCIWWPMIRTERASFTWPWKLSMFWTSMIPVPSTPMLNEEPVSGCSKWFWPVANTSKSIDYIYFCCRYFILRTFFGISQFCKIRRFIFCQGVAERNHSTYEESGRQRLAIGSNIACDFQLGQRKSGETVMTWENTLSLWRNKNKATGIPEGLGIGKQCARVFH